MTAFWFIAGFVAGTFLGAALRPQMVPAGKWAWGFINRKPPQ
jgi:hypothetical protein